MRETLGVDLVHTPRTAAVIENQPGVLQKAQVLGDGRTGNREMACQFTHRLGFLQQLQQNGAASGVAQSVKLRMLVRKNLR